MPIHEPSIDVVVITFQKLPTLFSVPGPAIPATQDTTSQPH